MIKFKNIPDNELDKLIKKLDEKISFVNSEFGFELKSYGNILRIAVNAIHKETVENLIERVTINKELERALDNAGGTTPYYRDWETDRKSTRLNSSHSGESRMPSSA